MPYYSITEEQRLNSIADQIILREGEVFSYDLNIANYTALISTLPDGDWPENIVQYKNATLDNVPDELDDVVAQYQLRDRFRYLIKTERAERAKSNAIYQAMITLLPEDRKQELINAAVARFTNSQQQPG